MHRPLAVIFRIIALTVGLGAASAEAQTRPGSLGPNAFGTIDGVVSDTSLVPMLLGLCAVALLIAVAILGVAIATQFQSYFAWLAEPFPFAHRDLKRFRF